MYSQALGRFRRDAAVLVDGVGWIAATGLTLSAGGTISGTPGTAGPSNFTVKVTDSASVSATAALSLTINPPALNITTSSLPAGSRGNCLLAGAERLRRDAAVLVVGVGWNAAHGVDSVGGRDDLGNA